MYNLYRAINDEAKHCQANIRKFNSPLAFASIVVDDVKSSPVFMVNNTVHHVIGPMLPQEGKQPSFAYMYFFHDDAKQRAHSRLSSVRFSPNKALCESDARDRVAYTR